MVKPKKLRIMSIDEKAFEKVTYFVNPEEDPTKKVIYIYSEEDPQKVTYFDNPLHLIFDRIF